jgi:hypothetical protein
LTPVAGGGGSASDVVLKYLDIKIVLASVRWPDGALET